MQTSTLISTNACNIHTCTHTTKLKDSLLSGDPFHLVSQLLSCHFKKIYSCIYWLVDWFAFFILFVTVSHYASHTGCRTHYVTMWPSGLRVVVIITLQSPKCWIHRYMTLTCLFQQPFLVEAYGGRYWKEWSKGRRIIIINQQKRYRCTSVFKIPYSRYCRGIRVLFWFVLFLIVPALSRLTI